MKKADSDIKVIAELKSEFEFQIKDTYFRTLDLGQALVEKQRLEKQKELLTTIKQQQVEVKVDPINNIDSVDSVRYAVGIDNSTEESTSVEEKMVSVAFRVECTESQLKALGEFMKANGIKYGRA